MRLHNFLVYVGFTPKIDVSLFIYSGDATQLYLLVYVDDIFVMGSDSERVSGLVAKIVLEFKVCDMGCFSLSIDI